MTSSRPLVGKQVALIRVCGAELAVRQLLSHFDASSQVSAPEPPLCSQPPKGFKVCWRSAMIEEDTFNRNTSSPKIFRNDLQKA